MVKTKKRLHGLAAQLVEDPSNEGHGNTGPGALLPQSGMTPEAPWTHTLRPGLAPAGTQVLEPGGRGPGCVCVACPPGTGT